LMPLAELVLLRTLELKGNEIVSVAGLGGLTNLAKLVLWENQVDDITELQNLVNLTHLDLDTNQITNVDAVVPLNSLVRIYLNNNRINDFSPLLNNVGLGENDWVYLDDNYQHLDTELSLEQWCNGFGAVVGQNSTFDILESRDVNLEHDCD